MFRWTLNQVNRVTFVMVDATGTEVAGIGGGGLSGNISKAGGAFNLLAGTFGELGNGWYRYTATAGEADTVGVVSLLITAPAVPGVQQQNLTAEVFSEAINAVEFTYTVDDGVNPLDNVEIWISTDVNGVNVVWHGFTDTFGIAYDVYGNLVRLDPGNYYFWGQLADYVFPNPDLEAVAALGSGGMSGTYVGGSVVLTSSTSEAISSFEAVTGAEFLRPLPVTLLSLDRYARLMGINPVHFHGAIEQNIFPLDNNNCEDIWGRYSWNLGDSISHEDLAYAILSAEEDIANFLGFWPAPKWIEGEPIHYPGTKIGPGGVYNSSGDYKSVKTHWGQVIQTGVRATTELDTGSTVVYSDEDGDGFSETATISILLSASVDLRYVKVYFAGTNASPSWEIRPVRRKYMVGSTLKIIVDSWQLVDPALLIPYQWSTFRSIDITGTTAKFVSAVDVYLDTVDTNTQAQFLWKPERCEVCWGLNTTTCTSCGYTSQTACAVIKDIENGRVVLYPASNDGSTWTRTAPAASGDPDIAKVWYQSGYVSRDFMSWRTDNPLSDFYAQAIAWMATARLERSVAACGNVATLTDALRRDITSFSPAEQQANLVSFDLLDNPFGTKLGEVKAWQRISKLDRSRLVTVGMI